VLDGVAAVTDLENLRNQRNEKSEIGQLGVEHHTINLHLITYVLPRSSADEQLIGMSLKYGGVNDGTDG